MSHEMENSHSCKSHIWTVPKLGDETTVTDCLHKWLQVTETLSVRCKTVSSSFYSCNFRHICLDFLSLEGWIILRYSNDQSSSKIHSNYISTCKSRFNPQYLPNIKCLRTICFRKESSNVQKFIRWMNTPPPFSASFTKGENFCEFLFASLNAKAFTNRKLLL